MNKIKSSIFVAFLTSAFLFAAFPAHTDAAAQSVRPRDCTLTTVVSESGALSYVLPARCGLLMIQRGVPVSTWPEESFSDLSQILVPPEKSTAKMFYGTRTTYLDTTYERQPVGGYVLLTEAGQRYSFRFPGDNTALSARYMEVASVDDASVLVRFWPRGEAVRLAPGHKQLVSITHGRNADIVLTLLQMNADDSIVLRVQFPRRESSAATDRYDLFAATLITIASATLVLALAVRAWSRKHDGGVPKSWWVVHTHDRLK